MERIWLPGDTRQRIQDLIKSNNTTQAELAETVGLSKSALSRYLSGQTDNLGDGFIIRIAKHFNVSTDFLLGETDIPDRKNYDIEELGLSAESARLLYSGKIDAHILNLLLENPRFPQLVALLSRYQNEIVKSGIIAMNQQLTFVSTLLLDQAKNVPEDSDAATQAARDLQSMKSPVINADTTAIQNLFMLIVRDIKNQGEAAAKESSTATAQIMEQLRQELTKGQDSLDLKNLTSDRLSAAVMRIIAKAGLSEESLDDLGASFKKVLDEMKDQAHDE